MATACAPTRQRIETKFNVRLAVTARSPEQAWQRAYAAVAHLREQAPSGVTVTDIGFHLRGASHEDRVEMARARADQPTHRTPEAALEYRRIHRSARILERRLNYLDALTGLSEKREEHVDAEMDALRTALRMLDKALQAREPVREYIAGRGAGQTPPLTPDDMDEPGGAFSAADDTRHPAAHRREKNLPEPA